ncbi:MAG: GntR family transcriptional regulator [Martelella sp.]|uniref:GntR family transcriptional regulator n=1 Tax=unclassified Martelella TaxID=2629616 RepID=UPI000C5E578F|nr:GntR family transcriptional regulator [Martelella sp.]MAU21614.1 GntR family transcriptional regulator [Martelella sp.]
MDRLSPRDIFQELSGSILRGDLKPGTKLTEVGLAQKLSVNRATLREALFRLEERELIERTPYSGMRVATVDKRALLELYEIRELLEGRSARRAAELATKEEIAGLGQIVEASLEFVAKFTSQASSDARTLPAVGGFHTEIARIGRNEEIRKFLGREVWEFIRSAHQRWSRTHERLLTASREHQEIFEAIAARNGDHAEELMARHIRAARDGLLQGN